MRIHLTIPLIPAIGQPWCYQHCGIGQTNPKSTKDGPILPTEILICETPYHMLSKAFPTCAIAFAASARSWSPKGVALRPPFFAVAAAACANARAAVLFHSRSCEHNRRCQFRWCLTLGRSSTSCLICQINQHMCYPCISGRRQAYSYYHHSDERRSMSVM